MITYFRDLNFFMVIEALEQVVVEQRAIASKFLRRYVICDLYIPKHFVPGEVSLLLINDGQNLDEMPFSKLYDQLRSSNHVHPVLCVGIHAGKDRRNEYGTAAVTDYDGRGAKAAAYHQFILQELLPFIHLEFGVEKFRSIGFAGFSLGGLTALDMAWHYPDIFSLAGVFSGSLWWRSRSLNADYDDDKHRIMHQLVRNGKYKPGLRFYFTTGSLDETEDRNNNGIIDSIDDTLDLIKELQNHGYILEQDIKYINYHDGKHDTETWGRAMPAFLLWGFRV